MTNLLSLHNVTAGYGDITVLDSLTLSIDAGSIYALLGPNGGGKSTTIKVCSGQIKPKSGELIIGDRVMTGSDSSSLARAGICTIPEGKGIFPNLTVKENLIMMAHSGASISQIEDIAYHRFPQLAVRQTQAAGTLSGGEQQMLAISRALGTDPVILLLDELSMGLAPLIVRELYEIVDQIAEEGVAVLVVEQFAGTVLDIADNAGILVNGQLVTEGSPKNIRKELKHAYLG